MFPHSHSGESTTLCVKRHSANIVWTDRNLLIDTTFKFKIVKPLFAISHWKTLKEIRALWPFNPRFSDQSNRLRYSLFLQDILIIIWRGGRRRLESLPVETAFFVGRSACSLPAMFEWAGTQIREMSLPTCFNSSRLAIS